MTLPFQPKGPLSSQEVAQFLSPALGDAKALEVVEKAVARLNLAPDALERDQVLDVLELIAAQAGLIGISARFVKSRLLLEWPG